MKKILLFLSIFLFLDCLESTSQEKAVDSNEIEGVLPFEIVLKGEFSLACLETMFKFNFAKAFVRIVF